MGVANLGPATNRLYVLIEALTDQPLEPDPATLTTLRENVGQTFSPGRDGARGDAFAPAVRWLNIPTAGSTLGLLGRDPSWSFR